jgi:hypothetical protein
MRRGSSSFLTRCEARRNARRLPTKFDLVPSDRSSHSPALIMQSNNSLPIEIVATTHDGRLLCTGNWVTREGTLSLRTRL